MPAAAPNSRNLHRCLLALLATGMAVALALPVYWSLRSPQRTAGPEPAWRGDPCYTADPQVGHRQAASVDIRFRMGAIGDAASEDLVRHSNNHGCISHDDWDVPSPPIVAMVGDSHAMGVVATADNCAVLLQDQLRDGGLPRATVMNAAAGYYSLYQELLRARQLLAKYQPKALVVVLFAGNDLLELEDVSRPHVDDALTEQPAASNPPRETTSARMAALRLPKDLAGAFWQGLNQATYLHQQQDRAEPLRRKVSWVLTRLQSECAASHAHLTVVLVPSVDLAFPQFALALGGLTAEVVASGSQQRIYDFVRDELHARAINTIDLLPGLVAAGRLDAYAGDFHIWRPCHRQIANQLHRELAPRLRD